MEKPKLGVKKVTKKLPTSTKRTTLMKEAEKATEKKYSEFDLNEAFKAGAESMKIVQEAEKELFEAIEESVTQFHKWNRREVIGNVALKVAFAVVVLALVFIGFHFLNQSVDNLIQSAA